MNSGRPDQGAPALACIRIACAIHSLPGGAGVATTLLCAAPDRPSLPGNEVQESMAIAHRRLRLELRLDLGERIQSLTDVGAHRPLGIGNAPFHDRSSDHAVVRIGGSDALRGVEG